MYVKGNFGGIKSLSAQKHVFSFLKVVLGELEGINPGGRGRGCRGGVLAGEKDVIQTRLLYLPQQTLARSARRSGLRWGDGTSQNDVSLYEFSGTPGSKLVVQGYIVLGRPVTPPGLLLRRRNPVAAWRLDNPDLNHFYPCNDDIKHPL